MENCSFFSILLKLSGFCLDSVGILFLFSKISLFDNNYSATKLITNLSSFLSWSILRFKLLLRLLSWKSYFTNKLVSSDKFFILVLRSSPKRNFEGENHFLVLRPKTKLQDSNYFWNDIFQNLKDRQKINPLKLSFSVMFREHLQWERSLPSLCSTTD